ncbi:DUF4270 domain-containing protein [Flavobacteriales bacterium]|jgi:hypothetical protein|nr:DUF4270 domain-containing protein [Flavobacteriales bacterium]
MNKIFSVSLLVALLVVSCTDPNTIGLEVQPTSDNIIINSDDFINFTSATESVDSVRTDETLSLILGEIDDSDFGNNRSSFYSQILLTDNNTDLGTNPIVDSVVMSYTYSGYYGDDVADFTSIDVLVLQDDIYKDSVYYSTSYQIPTPAGMSYIESYSVSNDAEKPLLKVKLQNDFGDLILDLENDGLKDNEVFLENFKGINVVASAQNTMLYLNPDGSNSYLKIYYHNDNNDSLLLDFELGGDAARINLFNEKNDNAIIEDDSKVHLQSMAGYKAKITLRDLDVIKDTLGDKVINKVTIDFDVESGSQSEFEAHEKLVLVRVNNEGKNVFLTDFTIEGETHFGGKLEEDIYSFNITRYFYQLLNNSSYTNDLYLMPAGAAVNANRTILNKDIKLTINYSDL